MTSTLGSFRELNGFAKEKGRKEAVGPLLFGWDLGEYRAVVDFSGLSVLVVGVN
jgi:hypothetical protein